MAVSFPIDQWNHGYKIMILKCIQHIPKRNMLLLKDSLELKEQNLQIHDFSIKKCYIDKLDYTVYKYSNTYHSTIKMKVVDVSSSTCIDFAKKNNDKDLKFKVEDYVIISIHKNIFVKGYIPNQSEELLVIKKIKKPSAVDKCKRTP